MNQENPFHHAADPFAAQSPAGAGPDPAAAPGAEPADTAHAEVPYAESSARLLDDAIEQLKKAEQEAAAMKDAYLRARADVENIRRQAQADVAKAHRYGIEKFAESLLPVRDALEIALATENASTEALREGVELTLKQLGAAFEKAQLTVIDPLGGKFDPHLHQAMAVVPSGQPANTVVQVMQKGYLLNDRVLRPAMVIVAKGEDG
jgi:molecular chaperone GrpE